MIWSPPIKIFNEEQTMIYGYVRVSTDRQNVKNQHHEIKEFSKQKQFEIDTWIIETISSRKELKQRKLSKLLQKIKADDIIIATEISRLGRNMLEVMGILQKCLEKECQIWTLKENYRLGADIQSKVLAFAFSLSGEIERQLISQRTRESLKRLKSEGHHLGRPYGFNYQKLAKCHMQIEQMLTQNMSKAEIARQIDCSWSTLNRYIKKYFH